MRDSLGVYCRIWSWDLAVVGLLYSVEAQDTGVQELDPVRFMTMTMTMTMTTPPHLVYNPSSDRSIRRTYFSTSKKGYSCTTAQSVRALRVGRMRLACGMRVIRTSHALEIAAVSIRHGKVQDVN
jgi:hypothetical protein